MKNNAVKEYSPEITMLDPTKLLADRNTRFGLKKSRIESMKLSIIERGGVMQPIEVEPLNDDDVTANPGKEYRVVFGHYRLAGLLEANADGNNSFEMPAIVTEINDPVARVRRQLAENLDRENQSPIDKAVAIKELFDLGLNRGQIREIFTTPGGRKGLKAQPASNSFINMTLSFLDLSKKIQMMIHEGEIGVADAYFLTKQPAEKREEFVNAAIARRLKEIEKAEEDESDFLNGEKKKLEAESKVVEAGKALEATQVELEQSIEAQKAATAKAAELYVAKMTATKEAKEEAEAAHKAAEAEAKEAQKLLEAKRKELAKLAEKDAKLKQATEERIAKLAAARAAAKPPAKADDKKPLQVKASAAADMKNRPNADGIPITIAAVKKAFADMALSKGQYPKVGAIALLLQDLCNGRVNDKNFFHKMAIITGEKVEKATEAPKKAAAAKK